MTSSRLTKLVLSLAMAAGLVSVAGCAGQGDVDRSQPDKVRKSIFLDAQGQPKAFYFRQTYVDVPPTSAWAFEGTMGDTQKIRFVITEKFLYGYRNYDYAPGSENAFTGGTSNTDSPILIYAITSQFDVKREYNPGTGEQTNVISENTTDRPWDQRDYMRVDWSKNLANAEINPTMFGDPASQWLVVNDVSAPTYVQETKLSDPSITDRPIMTDDYLDFVQHVTKTPDYTACLQLYPGIDDGGPWDCGPAVVGLRNSFKAVKPSSYEPLEYPDNYPILDAQGNAIELLPGGYKCTADTFQLTGGQYSGSDCSPADVGAFSKFGFFRTVVQTYDRNYGATEAGRKYYANRWNIWSDKDASGNSVFDASGKLLNVPLGNRVPKQIVYYTNVEFPMDADHADLFPQAKQVTGDWNDTMKKAVAAMVLSEAQPGAVISPSAIAAKAAELKVPSDDPTDTSNDIVVLRPNSCNIANVQARLGMYQDLATTVTTATGLAADAIDTAHLTQVCSIMEQQTETLADGDAKKFTWQRNGDLRYSFFYWVDRPEPTMPLGYGPSSADPETGEIISASLYNYGAALDSYAQTSADAVELLNSQISVDDLLSGKTIADVLKQTSLTHATRDLQTITAPARSLATSILRRGGPQGSSRLIPFPGGEQPNKLSLIKGTPLEQAMMTPDILAAMLPNSKPGQQLSADDIAQASPVNWMSPQAHVARQQAYQTLAQNGCVMLGEFADDAITGLALDLKKQGLSGDALFKNLRTLIFRGLADHEMGHTMGLRHNFSGSSDALNYNDQFWKIHESTQDQTQRDAQRISEYRYSTVMDYGSRFNSDVHGLGKYDYAAIRFGYGQLIDVMPAGAGNETGAQLNYDVFSQDYTKLPTLAGGVANLQDGGVMDYASVRKSLSAAYQAAKPSQGGTFITPERPYKFLSDEFLGNLDAKQWDFGANQKEIVDDMIDRFKNYFVFNAFKRGRLNWTIDNYVNRLLERYFVHYTEAYQFYYFYGDLLAGTDLADDLLKASVDSLNALGEVLQTPEPGQHCPTTANPNVMVLPDPTGANSCLTGQATMNIQIPDGKPYFINFSDDYYYRITRAGSLYEKLAALIALTTTQAKFYRVDTFADSSKYAINFYSIFKNEMVNLLSGVIRADSSSYGGYVPLSGDFKGQYQPTPIVDLDTWGIAKPAALPLYMAPGVKRVDTPVNKTIQYYALGLSLANLDTSWDSTLDFSNYLQVSVKGSKDDITYGPGTTIVEYTHPQSGLVYRAPVLQDTNPGVGSTVIQELIDITGQPATPKALPDKWGVDDKNQPLPDWYTSKANMDAAYTAAQANTDNTMTTTLQTAYSRAQMIFNAVDYLVAYRVDLLNDIRMFRTGFGY
jgi:Met-zincin